VVSSIISTGSITISVLDKDSSSPKFLGEVTVNISEIFEAYGNKRVVKNFPLGLKSHAVLHHEGKQVFH